MKLILPKSNLFRVNVLILFLIVGGILFVESGPEPWLDSEKTFMARLHNSLGEIDQAKHAWATEKDKPEEAVPTFEDLAPYLSKNKISIENLRSLGVEYKLTSSETNQSDIATLTRGIRFRAAVCSYYRAGTTISLHTGWKSPPPETVPITLRMRLIWFRADFFLKAALFLFAITHLILFPVRKLTVRANPDPAQDASSTGISSNASTPVRVREGDLFVLIFGCLFCLLGLGFLSIMPPSDGYLFEKMDNGLGLFFTAASLVLPILCLRFLRTHPADRSECLVHRSAFLVSLLPAACILWSFLSAGFVTLPYHVNENDTKKITKGMTKAQVLQAIGSPRGSSSGEHKLRLTYDFQIKWGSSGQQFFVDLIDDQVVSAKIVRYGGELNDEFFESDFLKDLKAGLALPSRPEVEQACLIVCQHENRGIVSAMVLDLDLCLMNLGIARATGRLVQSLVADGVTNNLTKPFSVVMAKGPSGWHPTEYELMGVKGIIPAEAGTNRDQPVQGDKGGKP